MSHIALFLPDLQGGGAERVFLTLAKAFVAQGHRVDLVLARAEGSLLAQIPDGVRLIDLQTGMHRFGLPGLALVAILGLMKYLYRHRPDSLMSTLTGSNLVAVVAHSLVFSQSRLILREAVTLSNLKSPFRLRLMRWLYPRAHCVVALTKYMRQELIGRIGLPEDKVVIIPNPVDRERIMRMAKVPLETPLLPHEGIPLIVGIGRLHPQKGFTSLIKAFSILRKNRPARLIILGEGPLRPNLEDLIRSLELQGEVFLPGFDSNPYRWLIRARVFVLSSLWEGYPNVLLEAKVLGVPVVTTEYDPSIRELAEFGDIKIVPLHDLQAMEKGILDWLESPIRNCSINFLSDDADYSRKYIDVLHGKEI